MASHRGAGADVGAAQFGGNWRNQQATWRMTTQHHGETHVNVSASAQSVHNSAVASSIGHQRPIQPIANVQSGSDANLCSSNPTQHGENQNKEIIPIADTIRISRISLPSTPQAQVVVHYAVPEGQHYLPIAMNNAITMIYIGQHDDQYVYEPINDYLQSPEDGLRYHRSMNVDDMYEGCLDLATFGKPVVGARSDDQQWLVNPMSYDPTRPSITMDNKHGEIR